MYMIQTTTFCLPKSVIFCTVSSTLHISLNLEVLGGNLETVVCIEVLRSCDLGADGRVVEQDAASLEQTVSRAWSKQYSC